MERALGIGDDPRFEIVRRSGLDPVALRSAGAVLFYDTPVPTSEAFDRWVREGGGVIIAAGSRLAGPTVAGGLLPGTWRGRIERVADRGAMIGDVSLEHPIFEPFRTGASATLGEPRFLRYPRVDPVAGAEVLARFDDGHRHCSSDASVTGSSCC